MPAPASTMTGSATSGRVGDDYIVSDADRRNYREHGYITLPSVLREDEIQALEGIYERFTSGSIPGMGRDLCDMSGTYADDFSNFALINAMLPRRYHPALQGNLYERLSASIARQLLGPDIALDYDQFLSKKPNKARAAFAMHQDMGYWPVNTPDTRTATCSLAITDSLLANGCICFVPGSQRSGTLFRHRPKASSAQGNADRSESHTLEIDLPAGSEVVHQEVRRGGITVHDEWVVHGSAGNSSNAWRKTYIIAYRSRATVDYERSIGFTHSHNDTVNWKTALELA